MAVMRSSRSRMLAGAGALAAAALTGSLFTALPAQAAGATGTIAYANAENAVKGSYIVTLKSDTKAGSAKGKDVAKKHGAQVEKTFRKAVNGYTIEATQAEAAKLAADPAVALVEQNRTFTIQTTQTNPTWGLDRIDQTALPLNSSYTYDDTAGAGVTAYVIDTGVRISHTDFGGRARNGYDAVDGDSVAQDGNGHGTHVAGTIAGSTYGVAKKANIVGVRVLDNSGSGTTAGVIDGVDWVASNAVKPAVANMSLGGGASSTLDTAVRNAIASGVTFAVAAGNESVTATGSPARVSEAITVGATTSTDARASYSNYGSALDIFAPGSSIKSTWNTGDSATNTISGTSMATPHVAGAAALYLADNTSASPATVASALIANSVSGKVTSPGTGSPNRLLYVGAGGTTPPPGTSFSNTTDYAIGDNKTVESSITVSGVTGNAPATLQVPVNIVHTYIGDLQVQLIAPDGSAYTLKAYGTGTSTDNINTTYTVNASSEVANGTWKLRVSDNAAGDTGYINSWGLTF
ncbi:S8 family peptidase [Streptomyces fragilis]|uniref:S8 family peptidase n=1 Tax=Streptomyces fragilis TaxID=67301 RepID=A0ABV2YET8_9ACTN|nr:S8 family peptidase [Streptomyces fragilis]